MRLPVTGADGVTREQLYVSQDQICKMIRSFCAYDSMNFGSVDEVLQAVRMGEYRQVHMPYRVDDFAENNGLMKALLRYRSTMLNMRMEEVFWNVTRTFLSR